MAVSLSITDRIGDAVDATTFTFTNRAIGAADATRMVLVGVAIRSAPTITISSVTIGGNAASVLVTRAGGTGNLGLAAIYGLAVPTGTTATIVVTLSGSTQRCQIIVASLTGDYDPTPLDTSTDADTDTGAGVDVNQDLSLDVANGGAAFFLGMGGTTGTLNLSYTAGATGDTQQALEALRTLAATLAPVADESPRTVTLNFDDVGATGVLSPVSVGVSFQVAADVTAPVLSNAAATATGETTAALAVDTDEGNGTLSWVVTTSSSQPSGAQIVAGQDHTGAAAADSGSQAVVGTGTQNANAAGLTEGTAYWAYFVQDDAATNRSNIVSDTFTTDDADQPPVTPIAASEGAGGGGNRRRGRRYPYPNVIDDGWDYDAPDARAEPVAAPKKAPEPPQAPRKPAGPVLVAKTEKPPVAPPQAVSEPIAKLQAAEPAADARVAALEAEVESLRAKVERLEAARRDDEEEQRLLSWLMEDSEA